MATDHSRDRSASQDEPTRARPRTVIVDADACPRGAMEILRRARRRHGFRLVTVASFNHQLGDDPSVDEHVVTGGEPQATDLVIANRAGPGDIVVTQDWGLATLVLGRGARALSPAGRVFDPRYVEFWAEERHIKAKVRRGGGRTKGPPARTAGDDARFQEALEGLLRVDRPNAPNAMVAHPNTTAEVFPMNYRTLGRTGLRISEIGFGAWGIGKGMWVGAEDDESIRALERAIDLGLNFIDTALVYGDGHSESLVGQVVRRRRERIYVASKIPPRNGEWPARPGVPVSETFPAGWVITSTERSLRNLGLETIDVQQFHVWSDEWVGQGDWLEAVEKLKAQGKIRFFGVSINDHEPENALKLIETGVVDTVQVIYNVFDQSPEDRLFPACQRHNVGVIVRVPFDEGGLTGRVTPETTFPEGDFRNEYFAGDRKRQVYERVQRIAADLGISLDQLPEVALRFVLSHPAVSTVIPGMRSVRNVERNCAAGDGRGLAPEQVQKLRAHRWIRNFYS